MASLFNDFRLPDIQTANEALATIFGIVERNAFFFLCGFVVVLYIYKTFLSEIVTKGMKEYRMSSAMKHTNNSSYKEMEKKSRSRLVEKYVPKKKEKKNLWRRTKRKLQVVSSRLGSIIRLLEAQVVAATSLQDVKFAEEDEASLGKDKVSSFSTPTKALKIFPGLLS